MEKKDIWVVMETDQGQWEEVGYEMLNFAQVLAFAYRYHLVALVIGYGVEEVAWETVRYGAESAILVDHSTYEHYHEANYLETIGDLFAQSHPEMIFVGGTERGRSLATHLAVKIGGVVVEERNIFHCLDVRRQAKCQEEAHRCIIGVVNPGEFEKCPYNGAMMGNIVDGYQQLYGKT